MKFSRKYMLRFHLRGLGRARTALEAEQIRIRSVKHGVLFLLVRHDLELGRRSETRTSGCRFFFFFLVYIITVFMSEFVLYSAFVWRSRKTRRMLLKLNTKRNDEKIRGFFFLQIIYFVKHLFSVAVHHMNTRLS